MIFNKFTELSDNHHNPIFEHFHQPNKFPYTRLQLIRLIRQQLIYFLPL